MIQLLLAIIYLSFSSLGLSDALLGSAWPVMYSEFGVPVSYAGIISMIIAVGIIISSLLSDRLSKRFGTGKVTAMSVGLAALALFGFSFSHSFWLLCIWAILYGFGAGSVEAALNNYVALHYSSRHMSWFHCMWGVGAFIGPFIMGYALTSGQGWNTGYQYIAVFQIVITAILLVSLPVWKKYKNIAIESGDKKFEKTHSLKRIINILGVKEIMITFFCYSALEQTTGLWGSSFLVLHNGIKPEDAAHFTGLFFLGITIGRALSGFLTMVLDDVKMIRLGQVIILVGISVFIYPTGNELAKIGLVLIGLGCAPIYPSIIHSTPKYFGSDKSQTIIGIQMASAYAGSCFTPFLFGLIAEHVSIALFPIYLLFVLVIMVYMHEKMIVKSKRR